MKTVTFNGFIQAKTAGAHSDPSDPTAPIVDGFTLSFWRFEDMRDAGHSLVGPVSFNFTLPESFDPRGEQVEILKAKKAALMAEFQARCTSIERQISEMTAITFEVAA